MITQNDQLKATNLVEEPNFKIILIENDYELRHRIQEKIPKKKVFKLKLLQQEKKQRIKSVAKKMRYF